MPSKKRNKAPPPTPSYPQLTKHPAILLLMKRLTALESTIPGMASDLRQAQSDVAALSTQVHGLTAQIQGLSTRTDNMRAQLATGRLPEQ